MSTTPRVPCLLLLALIPGWQETKAVPQDENPVRTLLEANRRSFEWTAEGPQGDGVDWLVEAAAEAGALVIGESHGNRETPQLTQHFLQALQPAGYNVFAIEVGPVSTRRLVELAENGGVDSFREFLESYPLTFPFFGRKEEAQMLGAAVAQGYRVWGLDQEFAGSGRYLLEQLEQYADEPEAAELVAGWLERAWGAYEQFLTSGERGGFLNEVKAEDFDQLDRAFAHADPEALEILAELRQSARIYREWREGANYASNHRRIQWMKHHFHESRRALPIAERESIKPVLKFGAMHGGRGYSPLNQLDVGNLAAELAASQGRDSLHLYVTSQAFAKSMIKTSNEDSWLVFDLRALRPWFHRDQNRAASPALGTLVFRYDIAVVAPEFHPAEPLVEGE